MTLRASNASEVLPDLALKSRFGRLGSLSKRIVARAIRFATTYQAVVNQRLLEALLRLETRLALVETLASNSAPEGVAAEVASATGALTAEIASFAETVSAAVGRVAKVDERMMFLERTHSMQRTLLRNLAIASAKQDEDFSGIVSAIKMLTARLQVIDAEFDRISALLTIRDEKLLAERDDARSAVEEVRRVQQRHEERLGELQTLAEHAAAEVVERARHTSDVLTALKAELQHTAEQGTTLSARLYALPYMARQVFDGDQHGGSQDEFDYVGFEEVFRGSETLVSNRQRIYLSFFKHDSFILDIGCGRGEMLELLIECGFDAIGIDSNAAMVEHCRQKGLKNVVHGDALEYLRSRSEANIGAIFSAQVIEHLEFEPLYQLCRLAYRRLVDGGVFIAETTNPNALEALKTFYVDPTHVRPLFPETMRFVCRSAGFRDAKIFYPMGGGFQESEPWNCTDYAVIATK